MRKSLQISSLFAFALAACVMGASIAQLTLVDALTASAQLSTAQATDAVRDAIEATARARSQPRASIGTSLVSQPQSGTSPQYQAAVQYTFDFGSTARRLGALQAARAQLSQSSAALDATRRATTQAVISAFFSLATTQLELAAETQTAALTRRTLDVARARYDSGAAPRLDVERANAADAVAQSNLAATTAALDGARAILKEFVGDHRSFDGVALLDVTDMLPPVDAVTNAALKANPGVAAANAVLRSSEATASIARGELSPGLRVALGPGISRTGSAQSIGPAATVALDVPLSNTLLRSNVAAADASVLVSRAALEQSRKEAVRAALRARADAASAIARLPMLRVAMLATKHVADADLSGYRLGAVSIVDLIAAQTQATAARAALGAAFAQTAESRASLQLEMGDLSR